jgi:nicotinate-nucleotide adenylyltransferase
MRIGLLGGSFDPPHRGHLHVSQVAINTLGLDAVWWLVSPGNPLKSHMPKPLSERVEMAKLLAAHPKIKVSSLEERLGTRYTVDTLAKLRERYRQKRTIWIMGADNLAEFHRWRRWREIMSQTPVAIMDRPGWRYKALASPAARTFARYRLDAARARLLPLLNPPAWCMLAMPMANISSTAIRTDADLAAFGFTEI